MPIPTRPALSANYVTNQANQALNYAANRFQNVFDRIRSVVNTLGSTITSASYGLRQEVPFERWFFDHGFDNRIDKPIDLINAHAWALLAVGEGTIRTGAELISLIFSNAFEKPEESERHLDVFNAQWIGLKLSLLAVLSPNDAKAQAHAEGNPIIGASLLDWKWGSLYAGTLDAPLWKVECRHYPWVDRA